MDSSKKMRQKKGQEKMLDRATSSRSEMKKSTNRNRRVDENHRLFGSRFYQFTKPISYSTNMLRERDAIVCVLNQVYTRTIQYTCIQILWSRRIESS